MERWFGFLTDQMNRRGAHKSVQALKRDIRARNAGWNEDPKPFGWKKTTEEILDIPGPLPPTTGRHNPIATY